MVADLEPSEDRGMDEPTLNCLVCSADAQFEVLHERLDDSAEWRRVDAWPTCTEHLAWFGVNVRHLKHYERLVVMRCG